MATGCGGTTSGQVAPPEDPPSTPASAQRVDKATAEQAFGLLLKLEQAWEQQDCAAVDDLTAGAENTLGGRACEATRNGRPAPRDPEFFLPDDSTWFVALAEKAYYLFAQDGGRWRLAAGPIPLFGEAPEHAGDASPPPGSGVRAKLVGQRHLTFLTDPAGVSGVRFPKDDPISDLLAELTARPERVKPDKLKVDVELVGEPARALALANGSMLVFHALRIVYAQTPGSKGTLVKPIYPKAGPDSLTATELVLLATEVDPKNNLTTRALRRDLADLA